jgi:hypothetical protein
MSEMRQWRRARFCSVEERTEFISRATNLGLNGIEVESLDDDVGIRFKAPARFEIGLAHMIDAHGGKVMPSFRSKIAC